MSPVTLPAILVVDDDADHGEIVRLVLRALAPDVPVQLCGDGQAAIVALAGQPRGTLILVDRVLAGVDSFDTVVRMRTLRPDTAVVMLSAALSSIDRAYALACGAADAIEKPASLAGWRAALAAILDPAEATSHASRRAA